MSIGLARAAALLVALLVVGTIGCTGGETGLDAGLDAGFDAGSASPCTTAGAIEVVPCGACGTVERFCTSTLVWAYGECTNAVGACTPGTTTEMPCAGCGTQPARCTAACEWEPTAACAPSGECEPGEVMRSGEGCGAGETRELVCTSACTYARGDCMSNACTTPGAVETVACGSCGSATRFCTAGREWEYDACVESGSCVSGEERDVMCGRCGTRRERCSAACEWTAEACTGEGECAPGETRRGTAGCAGGETRAETCNGTCAFAASGPCESSDAGPRDAGAPPVDGGRDGGARDAGRDAGVPDEGYVLCNGRPCEVAGGANFCCYPAGGSAPNCRSNAYTCGGTWRHCDGAEDCGATEVCCSHYRASWTRVECVASCDGTVIE